MAFNHGIKPKLTSLSKIQLPFKEQSFSSSSLYLSNVVFIIQLVFKLYYDIIFIIQLVFKLCCFHHPATTLQRTISSIQLLFKQRSFSSSSFYFAKNYFSNPGST